MILLSFECRLINKRKPCFDVWSSVVGDRIEIRCSLDGLCPLFTLESKAVYILIGIMFVCLLACVMCL